MRRFGIKILLFTVLLTLINIILNHISYDIYLKSYREHSIDFGSYFLADSHGVPMGKATEKYGVYNFSAESESYCDMEIKLKYLIENSKIDTLYITVDDHTLSPYRESNNNSGRSDFYLTPSGFDFPVMYYFNRLISNIAFFQPERGAVVKLYIVSLLKKLILKSDNPDNNSQNWSDLSHEERLEAANSRFKQQFSSETHSHKLEKSLLSIIDLCKENEIMLIGVKFPLSEEYICAIGSRSYGASDIFVQKGIPVLNMKDLYISNDEFFTDEDHMNTAGAVKFVDVLFEIN